MYFFNPYSLCACGAVWCSYARPCRLLKSRDQRVPLEVQPLKVPQLAKADREPGDLVGVEVQVPQLGHLTEVFGQFFKMAGLVTNSIRFCWLSRIGVKKVRVIYNRGLCRLFLTVFLILYFGSNARGKLRALSQLKKALPGSETVTGKLVGGTEENSIVPIRGHWFALQTDEWFYAERKRKDIKLMARPSRRFFDKSSLMMWVRVGKFSGRRIRRLLDRSTVVPLGTIAWKKG